MARKKTYRIIKDVEVNGFTLYTVEKKGWFWWNYIWSTTGHLEAVSYIEALNRGAKPTTEVVTQITTS